ncbi:hypothetical protein PWT90_06924 [Aphanocladium album]|nr:hypothetical protein PWT90_06924 [Aphanocladium album]
MAFKAIPILKFVGTVSLGLLTGVSYTVSRFALPSLLQLPSSAAAVDTLTHLVASLQTPILALSSLTVAPFALAFALAPRHARHPYLLYASLLAGLSYAAPRFLGSPGPAPTPRSPARRAAPSSSARARMEASYEVLGDVHSEPASEEDMDEVVNGEDVRVHVQGLARGYGIQAGLAALGFAMSIVGLWGDGAPTTVIVS